MRTASYGILVLLSCQCSFAHIHSGEVDPRELELGEKIAQMVEERWERINDPAKTARLAMILERLTPYLTRPLPYETRLIDEPSPNAFSLPGGIIFVTSGMYDFIRSDSQLAGILAHELVHSDRKHGMIQASRNQKLSIVTIAIVIATQGQAAPAILSSVAQTAISNSYSKDLEREADLIGVDLLANAGFEASGMLTIIEALAEDEIKHPWVDPGIYMSHPYIEERISYIIDWIREKGFSLHRKESLNLLKPSVVIIEGKIHLLIDGLTVWSGPDEPQVDHLMRKTASLLEEHLQLETLPYDIEVIQLPDQINRALRVGTSLIAKEPLSVSVPPLEEFRRNIISALLAAQKKHPITNFLR
ncbi:MAG TPA: M48 family metalloprotease [Synergistales bacterium]|nr:M48 family metalloprotease [Synergistales bacterium]